MMNGAIFIMLMALLILVSTQTRIPWNYEPTGQRLQTLTPDTAITFTNDSGAALPADGTYQVMTKHEVMDVQQPSTGETQRINVLVRSPKQAGNQLPAIVFMHGAGYGTCDNSFGDIAGSLASAGFVTAVIDKPVWSTSDLTRDYPGSAVAYDAAINLLRARSDVDAHNVGIYATSESTWISSYLLQQDHDIAFQILLSPMVFAPRAAMAFLAAQDFALVGANDGYQSIVRRVFSADLGLYGVENMNINPLDPQAYAVPTLVAYGSKDVMTAQVQGVKEILDNAHQAGNWNVTIRSYPVANHVLRLGDEAMANTPFADDYVDDVISWAVGTSRGLKQTSAPIAGEALYQSIAVPLDLHARTGMTIYGTFVIGFMLVMLLAAIVCWLIALVMWIVSRCRPRAKRHAVLGLCHGFGRTLMWITVGTIATLLLFFAGFGEVVWAVVKLAWGDAPSDDPGMMFWSWPCIQIMCIVVVWIWSRVFMRMIEAADLHRQAQLQEQSQLQPRRRRLAVSTGARIVPVNDEAQPASQHDADTGAVIAERGFGRVLFWITVIAMLSILQFFAFWGLFLY
ncbi:alpha/beta hydrolase family protein [Bifidobacterium gallicum]|nr:alpha/beta hydrolase [Bifidobacterium gallicum]